MKHYEIVLLVHPDQSDQVPSMMDRYRELIETHGGQLHRFEDWGRRQLAYPIKKVHKAHYLLFNIELPGPALGELENQFRFNDAVLRSLVISRNEAITEPSAMARSKDDEQSPRRTRRTEGGGDERRQRPKDSGDAADASADSQGAENSQSGGGEQPAPRRAADAG